MYPFPYTGLRLLHDEKVRDAMERARIDAELARNSRRTVQLSLLRSVLMRIRSRLNIFARVEHLWRGPQARQKNYKWMSIQERNSNGDRDKEHYSEEPA